MASSSEDEGPEDVLLVRGKDEALKQKKSEAAAVKRVKLSVKEKRRMKEEMFKRQKEAKQLRTLAKFPEGDLDKALSIMASEKKGAKRRKRGKRKGRQSAVKDSVMPTMVQVGSVRVVAAGLTEDSTDQLQLSGVQKEPGLLDQPDRYPRKKDLNRPAVNFVKAN